METRGQVATAQTMDKLAELLEAQQEQARKDRRLLLEQQVAIQRLLSQVLTPRESTGTGQVSGDPDTSQPPLPLPRRYASRPQVQPPHKLSPEVSLLEYKVWRSAWSDYEELLQLSDQPARTQLAHFRSCLTSEMRETLVHAIGIPEDDDTIDVGDILDSLHKHFQRQRNVTLRRVRFEERRQGEGELFDDYYVTLKELADDAELCDKCLDSRLVTRITSGIAN